MKAVVLAGGVDNRMASLLGEKPKTEVYLAGMRLIDRVVENLAELGLDEIIVVASSGLSAPPTHPSVSVRVVVQEAPGVSGAAVRGLAEVRGEVLLAYGDIVAEKDMYRGLLEAHESMGSNTTLVAVPVGHALETYSKLLLDEEGVVIDAGRAVGGSTYVFGGAMIGDSILLREAFGNPGAQGVFKSLIGSGGVKAYVWRGLWHDIDTPWDLLAASIGLLGRLRRSIISGEARISEQALIEGPVIIEDKARIDHGAVVRGPAYIGRGVLVGMGSFVREYTDAEEAVIIGSHSEVKRSIIQPRAYLGSYTYVTDSIIGYRVSLSPYVVTLNTPVRGEVPPRLSMIEARLRGVEKLGAIIGRDSRIGARSILSPGAVIKPGSRVKPGAMVAGRPPK